MEDNLIKKYRAQTMLPTLEEVISDLDFTTNFSYPKLRTYLAEQKICSKREFDGARHSAFVATALGCVPQNAAELIEALSEVYGISVAPPPRVGYLWTCPTIGTIQPCDESEILKEAHRINYTLLKSKIPIGTIGMAVSYWMMTNRKLDRQHRFESLTQPGSFDWATFGEKFFDDTRVSREVQLAVLRKVFWSVKRRLAGLPVTNHLMVVFYGPQGTGKSWAVEALTAVLGPLVTMGDFARIGDIREVEMFKAFVVILDEMQKASHADVERVKNVITRNHFNFKPLYTNLDAQAVQNATFIGTSNRTLDQMILDPTGNRRFFQIDWSGSVGPKQWEYFNSLSIEDMWRAVDHTAEDPTAPYMDEIRSIQAQGVHRNTVGQFFDAVIEGLGRCRIKISDGVEERRLIGRVASTDLYHAYRGYCDYMRLRSPLEANAFFKEAKRIGDFEPSCPFRPIRTNKCNAYEYVGPVGASNSITSLPVSRISLVKKVAA